MRKYTPFLLILVLLVAGCTYLQGEQTISLSDFKAELNQTKNVSVVVDTRTTPYAFNCGIALVQSLEMKGITTRYFFYDKNGCSYGGRVSGNGNASIEACQSMLNDPIIFYIQYNAAKNSTAFYKPKAVMEGDNDFLADCPISKII
jgi:hypothetical protein